MKISFHRRFDKQFTKLPAPIKKKVIFAIEKFSLDPFDFSLRNHPLHGKLVGKRAFSVTGDIRIIFEEWEGYTLVLFLGMGTHSQVY